MVREEHVLMIKQSSNSNQLSSISNQQIHSISMNCKPIV
ncbi:hypothetical protein R3I94_000268 [Phoxinus phoxinus]|uniref:Uncharacterized protein n=1 Tax=Phoxinus phoxinus TaxID=58324 RepID=A0AAN9HF38_9TELE